jgi:hypothetical protein
MAVMAASGIKGNRGAPCGAAPAVCPARAAP